MLDMLFNSYQQICSSMREFGNINLCRLNIYSIYKFCARTQAETYKVLIKFYINYYIKEVENYRIPFKSYYKIMFKTEARPAFKLKYFNCQKGSYHDGQVLNYICIQKNCEQRGLICSVCKNDHTGHNVIPLKYLINNLKNHQLDPMQSQNFQSELFELQRLKNSFLHQLKSVVQKFAQSIQKIQEQIMQQFKNKKIELLNKIQMSMKLNEIIQQTLGNKIKDQQNFQKDFKLIASLIQMNRNAEDSQDINYLCFQINLKSIVEQYEHTYSLFSTKLNKFLEESQIVLGQLLQDKKVTQIQPPKDVQIPSLMKNQYKFNPNMKGSNIKISNQNKKVSFSGIGGQRFALVDGTVQKKGSFIRFRVDKLKNWVGLGLAIKSNIISKKYQFLYNNIGHGSFLLSNNSYSWSHSYTANNLQNSKFTFFEGHVIKIQVTQTQLIYTNQSEQNKVCKLPIALNQNEWKQACFCVNLCSKEDSTTIL